MKISIIGAGPIGCYTGYLLAKEDHEVTIYENHSQVGCPIQCTGLLTKTFDQFEMPLNAFLVNRFIKITVNSPKAKVTLPQKEYLVCRTKFDQYFASLAQDAGAKILVHHTFLKRKGKSLLIKDTKRNKEFLVTPQIVIGADGPLSPVAKAFGIYHKKRKNYFGMQTLVEGTFDPSGFTAYFGKKVCPDLFAWVVPESKSTARVGVAMHKDSRTYFEQFLKQHGFTAGEFQAGTIPLYCPKQKLQKDNCYLVGDAATFVKATTLGGLIPGLQQAQKLAESIVKGRDYEKLCRGLRRELWLHLKIKNIFDKFNDKDYDHLVRLVSQPRILKTFERHTRDHPWPLVISALIKEPRFFLFAKSLFRTII